MGRPPIQKSRNPHLSAAAPPCRKPHRTAKSEASIGSCPKILAMGKPLNKAMRRKRTRIEHNRAISIENDSKMTTIC